MLAGACRDAPAPPPAGRLVIEPLALPAATGTGCRFPRLCAGGDGRVYLSWMRQVAGELHALEFAVLEGGGVSAPRTVAEGDDWFVNWADFPSVTADGAGTLAAHWLQRSGSGRYAYGVRVACSTDGGARWGEPFWLHDDRQPTEHGFATLVPRARGFEAVWLDGRELEARKAMTLYARAFDAGGVLGPEQQLDPQVCECCATAAARVGDATLVAFRDRSAAGVRDIAITRSGAAAWSAPAPLHDDRWERPG